MTRKDRNPEPPENTDPDVTTPEDAAPEPAEGQEGGSAPAAEADLALAKAEDRFLRLAAEYDNYRKRTIKEKSEAFDRGAAALATELLDVLDDFDRLMGSDPETTTAAPLREAVTLIARKLAKELESAGLERLDPVGSKFDPEMQDAVALAQADDPVVDDTVKATFQVGYRFRGLLIRPAKVQVWSIDGSI